MANKMKLTLELTAIDRMSKVVSRATRGSIKELNRVQAKARRNQAKAQSMVVQAGVVAAGGAALLAYPLKMAANYERLRVSMIALTGSASKGMQSYKEVIALAAGTPLRLEQVAANTVKMIGYGQAAEDATKSVKMLGDITAMTNGDIDAAIVAYGQARQEGKLLSRDLRQFINAGVPIVSILQKQLGAHTNIFAAAADGKITFDLLQKSLRDATTAGGQFNDGLGVLSKTGEGLWVRLLDSVDRFAAAFGDSVMPMLKSWGEAMIPILTRMEEWVAEHKTIIKWVMTTVMVVTALAAVVAIFAGVIWLIITAKRVWLFTTGNLSLALRTARLWTVLLSRSNMTLGRVFLLSAGRVATFSWGLITMAAKGIWAAITGISSLIASIFSLNAAIFSIPIVGWILAIVAAIIALGVAIYKKWDVIKKFFSDIWVGFKDLVEKAWTFGSNFVSAIADGLASKFPMLAGVIGIISDAIGGVVSFFGGDEETSSTSPAAAVKSASTSSTSDPFGFESGGADLADLALAPVATGGGGASINYAPNITITGGDSEELSESFSEQMAAHKDELGRMMKEIVRSEGRKQFAGA